MRENAELIVIQTHLSFDILIEYMTIQRLARA